MKINIEIKAICRNTEQVRGILLSKGARFIGTDKQEDTYFNVNEGRLKLRVGNIENNLIFYKRTNQAGPKQSDFKLVKVEDAAGLKEILTAAFGVLKVVYKSREIYFIENVKFHLDFLAELGNFVEIEASNLLVDKTVEELRSQCEYYSGVLSILPADLLTDSYSDMR
ncbi:MAG: class IV adenylate cyclase [Chitinophagaceae bacterium]